jgi:hypothetical protein
VRVAIGLKSHSGWAAVVAVGIAGSEIHLVDRRRIELVEPEDISWAKQPYHAAEMLGANEAKTLVRRGIHSAYKIAARELQAEVEHLWTYGHEIAACALVTPSPMPDWSTAEILSVHIRMHKAEGVLFPEALAGAAEASRLKLVRVAEKRLDEIAKEAFGRPHAEVLGKLAALGKAAGPPWGKDQKTAALAAVIALNQLKPNPNA